MRGFGIMLNIMGTKAKYLKMLSQQSFVAMLDSIGTKESILL